MGQSWEQEISPGLRQAEQEGWVTGRIRSQRPAPGTVLQWLWGQWGTCHAAHTGGLCPKSTHTLSSGQAQLPVGLARVQGWGRSSSPSGAGACARTDPAPWGVGTSGFRIDLSQRVALVTQQFQGP